MTNQFTNGYALLIGVNENSVASWALPDVIKDINAVSTVLSHPERCATDFAEAVSDLQPQRLLVILDCCHAGGMGIKDVLVLPQGYFGAAFSPALLMKGEKGAGRPRGKGLGSISSRGRLHSAQLITGNTKFVDS